jgi:hypothetical protein
MCNSDAADIEKNIGSCHFDGESKSSKKRRCIIHGDYYVNNQQKIGG